MCWELIKTLGTVLCPVFCARYVWIADPSSNRSSSITFTGVSGNLVENSDFVELQKGQVVLEKTATGFSEIADSTNWMEEAVGADVENRR